MEDLENIVKYVNITSFEKDSVHWVHITHIIDPHNFFVRLSKYRELIQRIESTKPLSKPSHVDIQKLVLFNLNQDSSSPKYARGIIQYLEKTDNTYKCDIYALDYGCYARNVKYEHIWECEGKFVNIFPLAMKCQLAHCTPKKGVDWEDAIKAFKSLVRTECTKMIISEQTSEKLIVLLCNTYSEDISTLLALTDFTTLGYTHTTINKINPTLSVKVVRYYYHFKKIELNMTLHVRTLSGRTLEEFFVAEMNDYIKYLKECENIAYYSSLEPEITEDDLKPGEIVAVQSNIKKYDRGMIKKVLSSNKAIIKLVDKGKDETVHITKIRKLPTKYLDMPILAIFCSAEMTQMSDDQRRLFLCPGYEFLITIKQLGHKFKTPNIISISSLP